MQISQQNTFGGVSFNKIAGLKAYQVIKKGLQHRCFPCEICELFKDTYFEEHLQTAISFFASYVAWYVSKRESTIFIVRAHV